MKISSLYNSFFTIFYTISPKRLNDQSRVTFPKHKRHLGPQGAVSESLIPIQELQYLNTFMAEILHLSK